MKRKRSGALFLVINVVISLSVALLVLTLYSSTQSTTEEPRTRPTIIVVYSPTPDPNQQFSADALQLTLDVERVTATAASRQIAQLSTPQAGGIVPQQATEASNSGSVPGVSAQRTLATIDPDLLPDLPTIASRAAITTTSVPVDGCERYFVQSGDTAGAIATRLGVDQGQLLVLNGLTTQSILQIGQELLVPGGNCQPRQTPTVTPTLRPTFDLNLTLVAPTTTLVATAEDSQVSITNVERPGDITSEMVFIQNQGGEINLLGWTLSDEQGNIYTFPDVRLVVGSIIRVMTRSDNNTAGFLYWNLNTPVWQPGETATLSDASGRVQSVFTLPGSIIEFSGSPTPGQ